MHSVLKDEVAWPDVEDICALDALAIENTNGLKGLSRAELANAGQLPPNVVLQSISGIMTSLPSHE